MNDPVQVAAMALVAAGLFCAAVIVLATGRWREAAGAGLELWLAAGLIRLSGTPTWERLAVAASIIVVRKLVRSGLFSGNPKAMTPRRRAA